MFFDGKKRQGDERTRELVSEIRVYYSHDRSADHLIKQFINKAPSPGEIWVVSSDKDIRRHAKKHRCHGETSEEFAKRIRDALAPKAVEEPEKDEDPRLSRNEISFWENMFRQGGG